MKAKKKILSLLLAIAMILGMLPMTALPVYAADATQIKIWDGTEMQTYTLGADTLPEGLFWNSTDNRLELDGYNGGRIEYATSGDNLTFYVVNDSTIDGGEENALKYSYPTIDGATGKILTLKGKKNEVMSIAGTCTIKNITVKVDQKGTADPNGLTTATSGNINVREGGRLEVNLDKQHNSNLPAQGVGNLWLYDNGSAKINVTANAATTQGAYGVMELKLYGTGDCDIQVTNNGSGETKTVRFGPPTVLSHYDVTGAWDSSFVKYTTTNFSVIVQNDGGGTGSATPANAGAGTEITLTANSNLGKQFKEWQVISGSVTITDNKFTMPAEDVTVKAIFEDKIYTVSFIVVGSTGCEASASPAEAPAGTEITLTATPASGYKFKEWQVISGSVTITDNKFTMPVGGVTIKAIFEEVPVTGVSLDQGTLSLLAGGATGTLVATVEPADAANKNVTWSSDNETVATVANGVVTPLSAGTATITVTTVDGSKTATCTVTVTAAPVTVTGISIKTAPSKVSYTAGEALNLSGLVVTLTKSDSNTEDVAFADFGTKGITASPANGTTLAITDTTVTLTHTASGKTATQSITVNPAPVTVTGISIKTVPSKVNYTAGEALDLSGMEVTLAKSDTTTEDVAFADFGTKGIAASPANGTTLATTDTTVTLTHTASGKTATQSITVTAAPVTVTGISIKTAPSKVTYTAGENLDLTGLEVTLAKSDTTTEDVAFEDFGTKGITASPANGTTLATTNTTVTLTHTASGKTATQTITVNPAPDTTPPVIYGVMDRNVVKGTTVDVLSGVTATDDVDGAVTVTANPPTIDTSTLGTTTVTYTATDTAGNTATTTATFTVVESAVPVTGVTLDKATLDLTAGGATGTLVATVAPANATNKNVTWSSSDTSIATVVNGAVTPLSTGTATITVKTEDGNFEATCTVTVAAVTYAVTLETDGNGTASASPATAEAGAEITLTASPSSGYVFKKWQVVSGSVTISGNKFTMPAENVTVKAIFEEASIPITITSVTVSPSSTSVEKGGTQTFTAIVSGTGAYDNTVTWSVYGGVAGTTIDYSGILTVDIAETAETLTVTAESNGDSGKKGTATVTITDAAVIKYILTVNNGSGSGEYAVGDTVNIYAGSRSGYTFNGWTSSDVTITGASSKNASFTMPAKNVTVTANWTYNGSGSSSSGGDGSGGSSSNTNATLSDSKVEFDKNEGDDLKVTLKSGSYNLRSIKNGSYTLREGKDYTISGRIVTIKVSYLDSLEEGKHSLTFDMNGGTDPVLTIIVTETTETDPQEEKPSVEETVNFEDVKSSDWFYDAVNYVYNAGLMKGNSDTTFNPYTDTTRGMIVTILHRLEDSPKADIANSFTDVGSDKYYTKAVAWASENKIVSGYGNDIFGAEDSITREQLAAILMNYAKYKGYDVSMRADLSKFADGEHISTWAKDAMSWANAVELIRGSQNQLMPTGNAQRSQVAAILQRFLETIAK